MAREYFPCYHSYAKKLKRLSDQEVGRLFRALFTYSELGELPEFTGRELIAFDFIAEDIDRAKNSYDERCLTNSENVKKRWSNKETDTKDTSVYETYDGIRMNTKDTNNKEKEKIKEKENINIITPPISPSRGKRARFTPPTVEEVAKYCEERGNNINAAHFVDYYTANGWHVGKQNMKDWKAAVRTWERNGFESEHSGRLDFMARSIAEDINHDANGNKGLYLPDE